MASSGFSSIMKLQDLDDFIAPSQECIKPVTYVPISKNKNVRGLIQVEDSLNPNSGSAADGVSAGLQRAEITLSDCLACSGCVTSAEVVLVNQQSYQQLDKIIAEGNVQIVVSLSPQAVVSLAHKHGLQPHDAAERLSGYFRSRLGAVAVWDTSTAHSISLLEAGKEVVEALRHQQREDNAKRETTIDEQNCGEDRDTVKGNEANDDRTDAQLEMCDETDEQTTPLPVLASACPGWVCYAEKSAGPAVLRHVSRARSPQQVMGAIVTRLWAPQQSFDLSQVYHVTVMPCYDKKLEASRKQFEDELTSAKDVDCVITSMEVDEMLSRDGIALDSLVPVPLSPLVGAATAITSHDGSSTGGYADFVLRYAARELYGLELQEIQWTTLKNADLQEASLEVSGVAVVRVCRAYGFRNLQNIVQRVKRNRSLYHYIEVMACPSGCLNGGAQIRPPDGTSHKELLRSLETLYGTLTLQNPLEDERAAAATQRLIDSRPHFARTTYTTIDKSNQTALTIKW